MQKIVKIVLSTFIMFILIYFIFPYLSIYLHSKKFSFREERLIYYYNTHEGLYSHTELILKARDINKSYLRLLSKKGCRYLSFSYGDRDFMADEGGFDDLNLTLAIKSLFTNDKAVIKVGCYYDFQRDVVREIGVSSEMLDRLIVSIFQDFAYKNGTLIEENAIKNEPIFSYYQSKIPYNLFHTCNSWTGDKLRDMGLGVSYFTTFGYYLDKSLDKIGIKKEKRYE